MTTKTKPCGSPDRTFMGPEGEVGRGERCVNAHCLGHGGFILVK